MKFIANPVIVDAEKIIEVKPAPDVVIWLESGRSVAPSEGMLARYTPVPGDYFVTQADGYQYLNPKDVFERKYRPCANPFGDQAKSA